MNSLEFLKIVSDREISGSAFEVINTADGFGSLISRGEEYTVLTRPDHDCEMVCIYGDSEEGKQLLWPLTSRGFAADAMLSVSRDGQLIRNIICYEME